MLGMQNCLNRNRLVLFAGAMEWLISLYKGGYGGLSAFWFYYSYWMVLAAFYYTFGVVYLNAKDDAEKELDKDNEIARAFAIPNISLTSIISRYLSVLIVLRPAGFPDFNKIWYIIA